MSLIENFPHLLHGGDYNPEQWSHAPEIIDEDFSLMKLAGCNTFTVGVFAWSLLEPEEGRFDFTFLDGIMDRMAGAGHNVILATPTGARPIWMGTKYEEIRRVNRLGVRKIVQGRHNHCWSSPIFREKVRVLNTSLALRYGRHPALKMWHISNEYHGECLCPLCLSGFRDWLRRKYETLDALNLAYWSSFWAHRFTGWDQVDPRDETLDGLALDWARFVSWQVRDFYQWEAEPLRQHSPGVPVLTNLMGFFEGVDYHALAPHLDIVADDSYPTYHAANPNIVREATQTALKFDLLRCLKGQPLPWFLIESCVDGCNLWSSIKLKEPGMHDLEMFQALAHGAEGTMYFQWRKGRGGREKYHGAVIGHNYPRESRSFREVRTLGERERKLDAIVGSMNQAEVALLFDWESRWAYRGSLGLPQADDPKALIAHAAAQYSPFWRRGITVNVLSSSHDFGDCKLILIPRLFLLKPGFADRLKDYVNQGGVVVMTSLSGMVDETNLCWMDGCPGGGLEVLTGVWQEEVDVIENAETQKITGVLGNPLGLVGPWPAGPVCPVLHLRGATPLLQYVDGWKGGTPAATVNHFGAGQVYFLGADLTEEAAEAFYGSIVRLLGLRAFLSDQSPLPPGVNVQCRIKDHQKYWFFLNFSGHAKQIPLPAQAVDVETRESVSATITLLPWATRILQIPGE